MVSIPTSTHDPSTAAPSEEFVVAVGAESPKVVEWEELHQEISRLWSLSSSLAKSKERKESLSRKVEDFVKVREESLRQSNELENMREKLEARKFAMGDMSMSTKEILEDVKSQRERICISARMLLVAGENLSAAHQQLQAVLLIASYLDVLLRYPLRFGGSRSYIHDYAPSIDSASSDLASNANIDESSKFMESPVFLEGQDATRAAYAIFLLNKDDITDPHLSPYSVGSGAAFELYWCRKFRTKICFT